VYTYASLIENQSGYRVAVFDVSVDYAMLLQIWVS